jgi:NAD(P)-dependent dehydrogenase (short-subunit alcohol dehydrogenase family)
MILKDKVIIVTGGSGLLGKAFINELKQEGAITINADINISTDLALGNYQVDITNAEDISNAVEEIVQYYGRIDGLVNNAYPRTKDWGAKFEDIKPESWSQNVDMQMNSYFVFCQEVLKKMDLQSSGSIINIASIYGVVGNDFSVYEGTSMTSAAAYSAIKGGIINFTRFLASYYGKRGIRVNTVSPGGIFDHQNPIFVANYNKKVPMGRMGIPEDIAPSVAFLLSDKAKYITGHNLIVDGGWCAI